MGLAHLGRVAADQGDVEREGALLEESVALARVERLALYRRLGIPGSIAACLEDLADVADARDRPAQAAHLLAAADAMRSTGKVGNCHSPPVRG